MSKPLVTYIKFLAPFPRVKGDSNEAPGGDLVHQLSEQLSSSRIIVNTIKRTGDWKWEISARIGELNVSTLVGVVDDFIPGPVNQWNAMHYSTLRLPWKLLPRAIFWNRHVEDHEHHCKSFLRDRRLNCGPGKRNMVQHDFDGCSECGNAAELRPLPTVIRYGTCFHVSVRIYSLITSSPLLVAIAFKTFASIE